MTPTPQQDTAPLRIGEIRAKDDLTRGWNDVDLLMAPGKRNSRYMIGFAASDRCVELAQRLRFEVFNLELKEGLPGSYSEGLDRDDFDPQMTHLVQIERATGRAIGTYRLQTARHGLARKGLYSAQEYHFDQIEPLFDQAVECGRACLAKGHRNLTTLLLLWSGISAFLRLHTQRWLFGCCSLTTLDPDDGWRAMKTLRAQGCLHPELALPAREGFSCGAPERENDPALGPAIALPKLFSAYMRLGAQVISEPALDRAFGTVDFLVLLDTDRVPMSRMGHGKE